jgi:hypothetical protein
MNRPTTLLTFFLLLFSTIAFSQQGFLFVKKGGKKKRTYTEGDDIHLKLLDGSHSYGTITLLRNDTIFINGQYVPIHDVAEIILKRKSKKLFPDAKTLGLIGVGAGLTTAGLALSKQAEFREALIAGLAIGYGPLLLKHFGGRLIRAIPRKKFRMGKRFRLQILDFHIPRGPVKYF